MDRPRTTGKTKIYLREQPNVEVAACSNRETQPLFSPLDLLTRAYHQALAVEMLPSMSLPQCSIPNQVEEHTVSEDSQTFVPSIASDDTVSLSDLDDLYFLDAIEDDHNNHTQRTPSTSSKSNHPPDMKSHMNKRDVFVDSLLHVHGLQSSFPHLISEDNGSWSIPDLLHMLRGFGKPVHTHSSDSTILLTLTSHPFRVIYASDVMLRKCYTGAPLYECVCDVNERQHLVACSSSLMALQSSQLDGGDYDQLKIIPVRDVLDNLLYYVIFLQKISSPQGRVSPQDC
jgi:hypothetical protein